jgi:hypothetical protein
LIINRLADAKQVVREPPSLELFFYHEANSMTTEFNELLPSSPEDAVQIWIIGSRDQVIHKMNEFHVRRLVPDRARFTPLIPAPVPGKVMTVLVC